MNCGVPWSIKGLLDFGPGEEEGKMSLNAKVRLGLEIGLHFARKEPAEWKRG